MGHVRSVHEGRFSQCGECNEEHRNEDGFMGHVGTVREGRFAKCEECNEDYINKDGFVGHVGTVHDIKNDLNKTIKMTTYRRSSSFFYLPFYEFYEIAM